MRKTLTALMALGLLAVPAAAHATPRPHAQETFRLPAPTGPHAIGERDIRLVDPVRDRELMISVWYPARPAGEPLTPYLSEKSAAVFDQGAAAMGVQRGQVDWTGVRTHAHAGARPEGRWPVVLYSPGWGSLRTLGTSTVEDLASRGYVVVTMDHTGEAPFVEFPGGRIVLGQSGDDLPAGLRTRVADARFVLDRLPTLAGLAPAMDLSRVGMFGHSFGGDTSAEITTEDPRVDAAADLDGWLAYDVNGHQPTRAGADGVTRPVLLMGSAGSTSDGQARSHLTSASWESLWEHTSGYKRDVTLPGAMHYSYTDLQSIVPQLDALPDVRKLRIGTIDPARSTAIQRVVIAGFFDRILKWR
ncbi:dienelactone hydrolase family protein [Amycolatopsis sp. NBC_00345]|uniref:alpha/beta hydrolase family protein n=1 Tax=Amycolatopsis sp. NBC_00345 TaxID=2975955 RepID=UPI002E25393B